MVTFTAIHIENFKRFCGEHRIPLAGKGRINVIAAENGVGKTTVLDAFYLALHGKKGMKMRKSEPDFNFGAWLANAFSSAGELNHGYMEVGVKLDMEAPELGYESISVARKYWIHPDSYEITSDLNLHIDGTILKIERGENKEQVIRSWMEALVPPAITQRFLVDGEQLGTLNVRNLGTSMKTGLDDLLGQGILHRLKGHLKSVEKRAIAEMAPEHERESLTLLLQESDELEERIAQHEVNIVEHSNALEGLVTEQDRLQELLQQRGNEEGSQLGKLRIDFAITSSELAQVRKTALEHFTTVVPYAVANLGEDLENLGYAEAKETLKNSMVEGHVYNALKTIVDSLEPQLSNKDSSRLLEASKAHLTTTAAAIPSSFRFLDHDLMEQFTQRYLSNQLDQVEAVQSFFKGADEKVVLHQKLSKELSEASQRLGMAETAEKLMTVSGEIGRLRNQTVIETSEVTALSAQLEQTQYRVEALKAATSADSSLSRRVSLVKSLLPILDEYAERRRNQLAEPLSENFSEGFGLLSRKSERIQKIVVSPSTYDVEIGMNGFNGNWLDRDLSATEKQHVGLSLLYALRRLASQPLPVVVDTPTSRMDTRHKGYSVTKFYPNLSHQVIVLATSDDLAGGLHNELKAANALGQQVLLKEAGAAQVEVVVGDLKAFF
jgi:DNA sulfur modification protein DndD